jgi:signal transduction histidine kinase
MSNALASDAHPVRRRLRLRARLALQLAFVAVVVAAATAVTALVLVRSSLEQRLHTDLTRLRDRVLQLVERDGEELSVELARLERQLRSDRPELLESLLRSEPAAAQAARRLLVGSRIELLEILDDDGLVVSSTIWQARAGLRDLRALELSTQTVTVMELEGPADPRDGAPGPGLALARRYRLSVGGSGLSLVAAHRLDRRFLDELGDDVAALLVAPAAGQPAASKRGEQIDSHEVESWIENPGPDEVGRLAGDHDTRWLARRVDLVDAGRVLGVIVVAVDRGPADALLLTMARAFLVLSLAAAVAAALAGIWIAGQITRPVARLVSRVDAIAAGQADYTFDRSEQHELDELVTAFSRLYRNLERQQQRSVAAERVAAWREVARRVAHEVKNPLAPIRLTLQNLQRVRRQSPERFDELFREGSETILEEVERLSRLVGEFSEFARLPLPRREPVDLESLIDSVVELHAAQPGLVVEREFAGDLPRLHLDADQITRALNNVLTNAIEAMRRDETGAAPMRLAIRTVLEHAAVHLEVADSGPGLGGESPRRIFEPYFTTKPGGTGLGMAMTYRIVTEHGGTIVAESRTGGGAVISIRLPLGQPGSALPPVEAVHRGGEEHR